MLDPITFNILQQLHLDASIIFLLGSCIREVNWQAALEDAHVLVGDDIKWVLRPCHQLHFNVVCSSDGCYYIQNIGNSRLALSEFPPVMSCGWPATSLRWNERSRIMGLLSMITH